MINYNRSWSLICIFATSIVSVEHFVIESIFVCESEKVITFTMSNWANDTDPVVLRKSKPASAAKSTQVSWYILN